MTVQIEKFIWDLTYACPLRCIHCYSESGRRAARMLSRDDALRIAEIIISARPERVSLSGGEPLLVPWWSEAARLLHDAGIAVTVFTSGWLIDKKIASDLAASVTSVALSVDGNSEQTHDMVRGRSGAFERAMSALEVLERVKRDCLESGRGCYSRESIIRSLSREKKTSTSSWRTSPPVSPALISSASAQSFLRGSPPRRTSLNTGFSPPPS